MTTDNIAVDAGISAPEEATTETPEVVEKESSNPFANLTPEELQQKAKEIEAAKVAIEKANVAKKEFLRKKNIVEKEKETMQETMDRRIEEKRQEREVERGFKDNYGDDNRKQVKKYMETNPNVNHQQAADLIELRIMKSTPKISEPLGFSGNVPPNLVQDQEPTKDELRNRAMEGFRQMRGGL